MVTVSRMAAEETRSGSLRFSLRVIWEAVKFYTCHPSSSGYTNFEA